MARGIKRIKKSAAALLLAALTALAAGPRPAMAAEEAAVSEETGSESSESQAAGTEAAETEAANEQDAGSEAGAAETEETSASPIWPAEPEIPSTAACLMDANNGVILYGKAMDEKRYPASITKIMTALLALENCNLDDEVTMDETGVAYATSGSSNLYTVVGEIFTVRELVYGTLMYSANDMATQLGKHAGNGSLDTFIQMMNDRAAGLGCTGTHFNNACGMPDEEHYTTAHDMALIMQEAIKNADFCAVVGKTNYTISASNIYAARDISSHNLLLVHPDFLYPGIIGGKSGYTDAAGYTLVNAASQNGMTLVVCTMKAPDFATSGLDNVKVLNYGYDNFEEIRALPEDQVLSGGLLTVPKGVTAEDCTVSIEETELEGQACERWTYTYLDHYVGDAVVTAETAALLRGETEPEADSEEVKAAEEAAGEPAGDTAEVTAEETSASPADEAAASESLEKAGETTMVANTGAYPTIFPDEEASSPLRREVMDAQFEKIGKTIIGISLGFILVFAVILISGFIRGGRKKD